MTLHRPLILTALATASLTTVLSGCAPLVLGSAAVGVMSYSDRRTSGAQVEDEAIELRGGSRLREAFGDRAHINITSFNRQVLLTGEVPSEQSRAQAEQVVSRVDNVRGIVNELAVLPTSTLTQRSNDTLITGKVKASLLDDRQLYAGAFKVVTERSVVYLMGRVTQAEADRATQIARTISGVQRVVRIFELLTPEEIRNLSTPPANTGPAAPVSPAPVSSASPAVVAPGAPATPAVVAPAASTAPAVGGSVTPTPLPPAR
ncbi:BON domain-containing protein [Ramlibacter aquaticus]|uniref:BON domain-containing protein n=1 Tax=Ramlibacter aquaticus TaxID=2780094 RepID=A0ABR9SDX9_9BURK|nr:BON domain-containing protein [Ramlibacter aquaticus]